MSGLDSVNFRPSRYQDIPWDPNTIDQWGTPVTSLPHHYQVAISTRFSQEQSPTVLTMQQARELHRAILNGEATTSNGQKYSVPHGYGVDHCYIRVEYAVEVYNKLGYKGARKVFVVSFDKQGNKVQPKLVVPTRYAADNSSMNSQPAYRWRYHVALLVRVQDGGIEKDMVIDPSLAPEGPVGVPDWISRMNKKDKFTQVESANVIGTFPPGNYFFTTPASVFAPTQTRKSLGDTKFAEVCYQKGCDQTQEKGKVEPGRDILFHDIQTLKVHKLAAQLRDMIAQPIKGESAYLRFSRILSIVRDQPFQIRRCLLNIFPNLVKIEIKNYLDNNSVLSQELVRVLATPNPYG